MFSIGFHRVSYVFYRFSYVFYRFSIGFHRFSISFHKFSIGFHRFSIGLDYSPPPPRKHMVETGAEHLAQTSPPTFASHAGRGESGEGGTDSLPRARRRPPAVPEGGLRKGRGSPQWARRACRPGAPPCPSICGPRDHVEQYPGRGKSGRERNRLSSTGVLVPPCQGRQQPH